MSQNPAAITVDQLRNREIVAADMLHAVTENGTGRRTLITAPGEPLSLFGRKMAGHDA